VAAPLSEGTKLNRNLPFVCEYLYRAFVHEQKGLGRTEHPPFGWGWLALAAQDAIG